MSEETKKFIIEHSDEDVYSLSLLTKHFPSVDMAFAIAQIAGRQQIKNKIPSWYENPDILYPNHLSLEQCSSEKTAIYKSTLVKGDLLVDLTGGFGVDCAWMSKHFNRTVYVEKNAELCKVAACNFKSLKFSSIITENADSNEYLKSISFLPDVIFLDPSRRKQTGEKVYAISDCEPDILKIKKTLMDKAKNVLLKLSPMLDLHHTLELLGTVVQTHVISIENECKEILVLLQKTSVEDPPVHCINITCNSIQSFCFTRNEEANSKLELASELERYLYEPNASIQKAGAYKTLSERYNISELHPNSHIYTSDELLLNFPGRIFHIAGISTFNKKEIKDFLKDVSKANIATRNFPLSAVELYKKLHLAEGGDVYLFATTIKKNKHILIKAQKIIQSS